MTEIWIQ